MALPPCLDLFQDCLVPSGGSPPALVPGWPTLVLSNSSTTKQCAVMRIAGGSATNIGARGDDVAVTPGVLGLEQRIAFARPLIGPGSLTARGASRAAALHGSQEDQGPVVTRGACAGDGILSRMCGDAVVLWRGGGSCCLLPYMRPLGVMRAQQWQPIFGASRGFGGSLSGPLVLEQSKAGTCQGDAQEAWSLLLATESLSLLLLVLSPV